MLSLSTKKLLAIRPRADSSYLNSFIEYHHSNYSYSWNRYLP